MSGSGPERLFPDWTRDATAASLRERREVLEGRLGRLAEPLRESTSPRFVELHALRDSLAALPEGRAWRERAEALTVAQEQRQAHVASTRRGRQLALALAGVVLAISLVGWASKRPRALALATRTTLRGQRIHTAGVGLGVAGHGTVTLRDGRQPRLRLHQGWVEVSAEGSERITVQAGPHAFLLEGGRMEVERLGGETTVRVAEGKVTRLEEDGAVQVLEPGGPTWEAPGPEEGETCASRAGEVPGGAPGPSPEALPEPEVRSLSVTAGGATGLAAVPGHAALGPAGLLGATGPRSGTEASLVASVPPVRRAPTLSLDADYRPWTPPSLVRTGGGERGRIAPGTGAGEPGAAPLAKVAAPGASSLGSSVRSRVALPVLELAHEVEHTVDGSAVPMEVDPLSGLGFCPLPPPAAGALPVPLPEAPSSGPASRPRHKRAAATPQPDVQTGVPPSPTREIPVLPGVQEGSPADPAPLGKQAATKLPGPAQDALLGVVFSLGIEGSECDP